jgi:hypothetical protein
MACDRAGDLFGSLRKSSTRRIAEAEVNKFRSDELAEETTFQENGSGNDRHSGNPDCSAMKLLQILAILAFFTLCGVGIFAVSVFAAWSGL